MTYFIIYLLIVVFAIETYQNPAANLKFRYRRMISLIIFICLAGLRYEIGVDFFAYREHFKECTTIQEIFLGKSLLSDVFGNSWEPLSNLLFVTLHSLTDNDQVVFFVSSVICSILLFKSFDSFCEKKYYFFTVLIYFSFVYMFQEMHTLRQALGASVFYFGLCYYSNNEKSRAFVLTIIAACFHYSLLVFLLILFLLDRKISIKVSLIFIIVSFIIFVAQIPWINTIIDLMGQVFPNLGLVIKLLAYSEDPSFERPFFITFILYLFPYVFLMYVDYKMNIFNTRRYLIAKNMYFWYLIFTMCFWEYVFFSIRYGWVCLWGMAICLPKLSEAFVRSSRYFSFSYIILFCYIIIHTFLFPDITNKQFTPYDNYISCEWFGVKGTGKQRAEEYMSFIRSSR